MTMADGLTTQDLRPRASTSPGPPFGGFGPFGASERPFPGSSWGSSWPFFPATASVTVTATVTTSAGAATSTPIAGSSASTDASLSSSKPRSSSSPGFLGTSAASSVPSSHTPAASLSLPSSSNTTSTAGSNSALPTNDTSPEDLISNTSHRRTTITAAVSSILGAAVLVGVILLVWRCRRKRRTRKDSQRGDIDPFDARPESGQDRPSNSLISYPVDTSPANIHPYRPDDAEKHDLEQGLSSDPTRRLSLRTSTLSAGATVGVPHPSPPRVSLSRPRPTVLRQETDAGVRLVLSMEPTGEHEGEWGEQNEAEETLPPPYDARLSA